MGGEEGGELCAGQHNRLLRRQHCSSLCSQSEGGEHVGKMASALGHDFVGFSVLVRHNIRPPSLCEQSELQCFASDLRRMFAQRPLQRCHIRYANWLKIYGVQISIKIKVGKEAPAPLKGAHI